MFAKTKNQKTKTAKTDSRPDAVGQVWGTAVGMLAICIPLCVLLKSGALPIIVIAGATALSMYIWTKDPRTSGEQDEESEALRARIRELEERLANVEVINSFEERLAERTIARQVREERSPATTEPIPARQLEQPL